MGKRIDLSSVNMLIVEPERTMALLISTIVRGVGVGSLTTAESANQAIDIMRTGAINCAIINEQVGERTAAQLLKPVRTFLKPSQFSAIMMSSDPTRGTVKASRAAGFDLVLAKPFSAYDLYSRASVLVNVTQAKHRAHEARMERIEALSDYYKCEIEETNVKSGPIEPKHELPVV